MYCPRCSQQTSDDAGFCTRCGFQLAIVKDLLVTGGAWPGNPLPAPARPKKPRSRAVRRGTKLIFFSIVLFPLFLLLSIVNDSPGPLAPSVVMFFIGLTIILYHKIFGEDVSPSQRAASAPALNTVNSQALPPAAAPASQLHPARANTAEIATPPSVTERTTNLLRRE